MKNLSLLIVLLVSVNFFTFGQKPVIKVKGQSSLSVKPTQTIIIFNIQSKDQSYIGVVENLVTRVDLLTNVLVKDLNFKHEEVTTSTFQISKNYVYERGVRKDSGFIATQQLKVQFDQNTKTLLNVLSKTTSSKANPEISITFDLDNKEKSRIKMELIRLAVKDAKAKASLIAEEAGYSIIGIQEINYGLPQGDPIPLQDNSMQLRESIQVEFSNFEADSLRFSDSVEIIFTVQKN